MKQIMIEDLFTSWVKEQLDQHPFITPSALTLKSFYVFDVSQDVRFDRYRSIAERTRQIYLKELTKMSSSHRENP